MFSALRRQVTSFNHLPALTPKTQEARHAHECENGENLVRLITGSVFSDKFAPGTRRHESASPFVSFLTKGRQHVPSPQGASVSSSPAALLISLCSNFSFSTSSPMACASRSTYQYGQGRWNSFSQGWVEPVCTALSQSIRFCVGISGCPLRVWSVGSGGATRWFTSAPPTMEQRHHPLHARPGCQQRKKQRLTVTSARLPPDCPACAQ